MCQAGGEIFAEKAIHLYLLITLSHALIGIGIHRPEAFFILEFHHLRRTRIVIHAYAQLWRGQIEVQPIETGLLYQLYEGGIGASFQNPEMQRHLLLGHDQVQYLMIYVEQVRHEFHQAHVIRITFSHVRVQIDIVLGSRHS